MPNPSGAEVLSAADASNLLLDARDQVNAFLMAGVLGPGGFVSADGAADLDHLRAVISSRLSDPAVTGLRRFTQRVGGSQRRPCWETSAPDLGWHVRQVESVAGRDGLAALCANLITTPLPIDRPLWELLIVPGAADRGIGVILRVHHAVADGVAGVRLAQQLFDPVAAPPAGAGPAPVPRRDRKRPNWLRRVWASVTRLSAMFTGRLGPTVLLGPIGPDRGVAFAEVDLAALSLGSRSAGGTVNDALLAAVSAATTAALRAVGEPVPPELPASVPVALPDRGTSGNAVGIMMVPLPLAEPDAADRIARIAAITKAAKEEARAQGTYELTRSRWGTRMFAFLARRQRFVALFVTNVRGPEQALWLAGAPLEQAWPVTPLQGNVRLGVAAMSYAGRLDCVVHVDAGSLDVAVVGTALRAELARIGELAP